MSSILILGITIGFSGDTRGNTDGAFLFVRVLFLEPSLIKKILWVSKTVNFAYTYPGAQLEPCGASLGLIML